MPRSKRKIYFLNIESDNYNFGDLLEEINQLVDADMYSYVDSDGGGIFLKSLSEASDMLQGSICRLRMTGLPSLGTHGIRMTEQLALAENQGLVECTHFIYFKNEKILGIEYNHHGPKASNMEWHITDKVNSLHGTPSDVRFLPIFDEDVMRALTSGVEVGLLRMVVPKENIGNLAQFDPSIHGAFQNAVAFGAKGKVELVIRVDSNRSHPLDGGVLKSKLDNLPGNPGDTFSMLKASLKQEGERSRPVDLLEGKFVADVWIETRGRSNEVNETEIMQEIHDAFQRNREQLLRMTTYEENS